MNSKKTTATLVEIITKDWNKATMEEIITKDSNRATIVENITKDSSRDTMEEIITKENFVTKEKFHNKRLKQGHYGGKLA